MSLVISELNTEHKQDATSARSLLSGFETPVTGQKNTEITVQGRDSLFVTGHDIMTGKSYP
jgi:hypothetical protein